MKFKHRSAISRLTLVTAVAGVSAVSLGQAQAPTSAPTSQSAPAEGMVAVVQMVEGTVRVRMSKSAPWQPATVGMQLPAGAEIRTGIKSAIKCQIPPDQTFLLDRLGTIELTEAFRQGNFVKTDLTMKYGRAQYEIERAGLEHDARITSPGSTLAVRGTIGELEDSPPFRPKVTSYTGRVRFTAERKSTIVGSVGGSTARMEAGQQNAAINALEASVIDPQSASSRTPADARLIAQQTSLGAVAKFDRDVNITVIRGGAGPIRTEAELSASLENFALAFVARWTGNADINLEVGVSKGDPATTTLATGQFNFDEFIYPGFGLNVSPSGGRTDFDHRGGPNGGQEIVYWKKNPPIPGTFGLGLINVGGDTTNVTINAFINGVKTDLYNFASPVPVFPDGTKSTTFTYQMAPNTVTAPLAFIPLTDHPLANNPDASGGAPADLPITVPAPSGEEVKAAKARRAAERSVRADSGDLQQAQSRREALRNARNPKWSGSGVGSGAK